MVTALNIAIENGKTNARGELVTDTCAVSAGYEELAALGDKFSIARSEGGVDWALWLFGGMSNTAIQSARVQTMEMLRAFRADPTPYVRENPWFLETRKMIRTVMRNSQWPNPDETKIRQTMCRLNISDGPQGTVPEFFRPKKTPDEKCPAS